MVESLEKKTPQCAVKFKSYTFLISVEYFLSSNISIQPQTIFSRDLKKRKCRVSAWAPQRLNLTTYYPHSSYFIFMSFFRCTVICTTISKLVMWLASSNILCLSTTSWYLRINEVIIHIFSWCQSRNVKDPLLPFMQIQLYKWLASI